MRLISEHRWIRTSCGRPTAHAPLLLVCVEYLCNKYAWRLYSAASLRLRLAYCLIACGGAKKLLGDGSRGGTRDEAGRGERRGERRMQYGAQDSERVRVRNTY